MQNHLSAPQRIIYMYIFVCVAQMVVAVATVETDAVSCRSADQRLWGLAEKIVLGRHTVCKGKICADDSKIYAGNAFLRLGAVLSLRVGVRCDVPALLKAFYALGIGKAVVFQGLSKNCADDIDMRRLNRAVTGYGVL